MQVELLDRRRWRTRLELANAIFGYLEVFHNRQRRHSALGCSARSSSRPADSPPSHEAIQLPDSTQPGACLGLHQTRGISRPAGALVLGWRPVRSEEHSIVTVQEQLTGWGEVLRILLRLTGPVLLVLALLSVRGRVKR
jgi:putative transposase